MFRQEKNLEFFFPAKKAQDVRRRVPFTPEKMMNMARRRLLPPLLSILLAFAATTAPLASAFGAGALSRLLGAPTTRHRDRDPSHAATSRGVGGSGAAVAAAAPAPTGGVRAAFTRRDVLRRGATTGCLLGSIAAGTAAIAPADADVLRSPGRCANGEGGGCDALSDGNEYIKSLQSKSRENREANQRVRVKKPAQPQLDDDGNLARFDFGWVGGAAVAGIKMTSGRLTWAGVSFVSKNECVVL
jgi:hypothetical protein